ncbi:MAG: ABC transporter ATP-binding protein, partial [Duncaniella sp.]|nr:ABC transporter ATP-binding protein [Duncaniella sp.]
YPLLVLVGNGVIKDFPGNYTDYREYIKEKAAEARAEAPAQEPAQPRQTKERPKKLSWKERKEFEALEGEIETLNAERTALEALFNSGESIPDIADKARRYEEVKTLVDEKEMRWLELSELA